MARLGRATLALGLAFVAGPGCASRVLGLGAGETDDASGSESGETTVGPTTDPTVDPDGGPPVSCGEADLGASVPVTIMDSTASGSASAAGSCGGVNAPERVYQWTAPYDGLFTFDTLDATIDTVLYLRAGGCDGVELACNDDAESTLGSAVAWSLQAGDVVTVVVDGFDQSAGAFTLWIDEIVDACPTDGLRSIAPAAVSDVVAGHPNTGALSCGGLFGSDTTIAWVAPASGVYRASLSPEFANWVLGIWDGDCGGAELGCRSFWNGGSSFVDVGLVEGQQIVVQVDGVGHASGAFTLAIDPVDVGECPELDLGSQWPVSTQGNLDGASSTSTASCLIDTGPDVAYLWSAPSEGTYTFDTIGSSFDTVLYVHSMACFGSELACDDDDGGNLTSFVQLDLAVGEQVVVVVDGFGGQTGAYSLHIQ